MGHENFVLKILRTPLTNIISAKYIFIFALAAIHLYIKS